MSCRINMYEKKLLYQMNHENKQLTIVGLPPPPPLFHSMRRRSVWGGAVHLGVSYFSRTRGRLKDSVLPVEGLEVRLWFAGWTPAPVPAPVLRSSRE